MQVPQWVKPGVWGVVIGAVAIMIVGFAWWGWTLSSTAERMATERVIPPWLPSSRRSVWKAS